MADAVTKHSGAAVSVALGVPTPQSTDTSGIAAAVAMAGTADEVILAVGTDLNWAHEEHDAESISILDLGFDFDPHILALCPPTHTHIHTDIHTDIHIYTHTHIHTYTHTHIHTYTHIHIHTYTHTHIHTPTYPHIHTSTHPHIHTSTHPHIHTSTHPHIHTSTHPRRTSSD